MMLQSWDGALRIFPAWPRQINARFENFRAEGAFLVTADWKQGRVSSVEILSEKGALCRFYPPWSAGVKVFDDHKNPVQCLADEQGRSSFATRPGTRYTLQP